MTSVNIRIPEELNAQLLQFSKTMDLPKSHLIRTAIKEYVIELQEDAEDIAAAEEVLANSTGETVSWEDVQRSCGLLED